MFNPLALNRSTISWNAGLITSSFFAEKSARFWRPSLLFRPQPSSLLASVAVDHPKCFLVVLLFQVSSLSTSLHFPLLPKFNQAERRSDGPSIIGVSLDPFPQL